MCMRDHILQNTKIKQNAKKRSKKSTKYENEKKNGKKWKKFEKKFNNFLFFLQKILHTVHIADKSHHSERTQ